MLPTTSLPCTCATTCRWPCARAGAGGWGWCLCWGLVCVGVVHPGLQSPGPATCRCCRPSGHPHPSPRGVLCFLPAPTPPSCPPTKGRPRTLTQPSAHSCRAPSCPAGSSCTSCLEKRVTASTLWPRTEWVGPDLSFGRSYQELGRAGPDDGQCQGPGAWSPSSLEYLPDPFPPGPQAWSLAPSLRECYGLTFSPG